MVPVIRDCDKKSFAEIEKDIANYATLASEGKLELSDLQGGVFTISNGGIYGSMLSTPIINPPQSAILAVGASEERVIAKNGNMQIASVMDISLSCDHRAIDGALGAMLLADIKFFLENPVAMLA